MNSDASDTIRIDKWLWHARLFKSRTLAGKFVNAGKVRINEKLAPKAHAMIKPDDVLTFVRGGHVRVVRIVTPGSRRGPATEAKTLYEDLSPPRRARNKPDTLAPPGKREPGSGRPTKADRRAIDKLKAEP